MMRSKASKDSSRGFQVSFEIIFLITIRKTIPTSGQTVDVTSKNFELNGRSGSLVLLPCKLHAQPYPDASPLPLLSFSSCCARPQEDWLPSRALYSAPILPPPINIRPQIHHSHPKSTGDTTHSESRRPKIFELSNREMIRRRCVR